MSYKTDGDCTSHGNIILKLSDYQSLCEELEAVTKQLEAFREQLVCEACQYQEIFNYTNDGRLAAIALDHKERILKLLEDGS
tara:strand:+ start:6105 stop:6350 length:246 start_codon:yes stop_codon:yes gene_type:complete